MRTLDWILLIVNLVKCDSVSGTRRVLVYAATHVTLDVLTDLLSE